ncbi:Hypothetical protein NTJ_08260 [Nesidiocoris tenuis]|uniref:Uncharacterized protein n=1 Tax=Nesidiocoris tenuis TaxID=355587 RepID=A0ABN7ATB8_9HEMI|nr:Hypothetical protein NTJ_08260 [Nesidiocoris tenuis]
MLCPCRRQCEPTRSPKGELGVRRKTERGGGTVITASRNWRDTIGRRGPMGDGGQREMGVAKQLELRLRPTRTHDSRQRNVSHMQVHVTDAFSHVRCCASDRRLNIIENFSTERKSVALNRIS